MSPHHITSSKPLRDISLPLTELSTQRMVHDTLLPIRPRYHRWWLYGEEWGEHCAIRCACRITTPNSSLTVRSRTRKGHLDQYQFFSRLVRLSQHPTGDAPLLLFFGWGDGSRCRSAKGGITEGRSMPSYNLTFQASLSMSTTLWARVRGCVCNRSSWSGAIGLTLGHPHASSSDNDIDLSLSSYVPTTSNRWSSTRRHVVRFLVQVVALCKNSAMWWVRWRTTDWSLVDLMGQLLRSPFCPPSMLSPYNFKCLFQSGQTSAVFGKARPLVCARTFMHY